MNPIVLRKHHPRRGGSHKEFTVGSGAGARRRFGESSGVYYYYAHACQKGMYVRRGKYWGRGWSNICVPLRFGPSAAGRQGAVLSSLRELHIVAHGSQAKQRMFWIGPTRDVSSRKRCGRCVKHLDFKTTVVSGCSRRVCGGVFIVPHSGQSEWNIVTRGIKIWFGGSLHQQLQRRYSVAVLLDDMRA